MAAFLTVGNTATTSADFALLAGDSTTLFLVDNVDTDGISSTAQVDIQIKASDGKYFSIGALSYSNPILVLDAVGTFRLKRIASTDAVGVDKN